MGMNIVCWYHQAVLLAALRRIGDAGVGGGGGLDGANPLEGSWFTTKGSHGSREGPGKALIVVDLVDERG